MIGGRFIVSSRLSWILFLIVVLLHVGSSFSLKYAKRNADCSLLSSNCRECTQYVDCGWCQSSLKCMNSTNGRPEGNCNIWWLTCSDPDVCLDHNDCFSCTKQTGCGWCDDQECLAGTDEGPTEAMCQEWKFGSNSTCSNNCTDFVDCFSCTARADESSNSCGWCNSTSSCMEGTNEGPSSERCQIQDWLWETCESSGEPLNCPIHSNCSTCVSDPSDRCGWCVTTKTCEDVETTKCPDFRRNKICTDSCLDFSSNCTHCATNQNCGWCDGTCVEGVPTGPSYRNCSNWQYHTCAAINDTCPYYGDCNSCLTNDKCGWCENGISSGCLDINKGTHCQGKWEPTQCTGYVFTCSSLESCMDCVNYPPGECVWCSREGNCRRAIEVGTSCDYSCGGENLNMGPGVITALVVVGVAVVGLAFGLWYRFYWVRRHYYERLR